MVGGGGGSAWMGDDTRVEALSRPVILGSTSEPSRSIHAPHAADGRDTTARLRSPSFSHSMWCVKRTPSSPTSSSPAWQTNPISITLRALLQQLSPPHRLTPPWVCAAEG